MANDKTLREVGLRLAIDVGVVNQVGCVNSRVTYVLTDGSDEHLAQVNKLGRFMYQDCAARRSMLCRGRSLRGLAGAVLDTTQHRLDGSDDRLDSFQQKAEEEPYGGVVEADQPV